MGNPVVWWEIASADAEVTAKFVREVFGWELDHDAATGIYTRPEATEQNSFGGGSIFTPRPGGVDPHTTIYIKVDDVHETARRAVAAGGTVYVDPQEIGRRQRICLVKDPVGVIVAAIDRGG